MRWHAAAAAHRTRWMRDLDISLARTVVVWHDTRFPLLPRNRDALPREPEVVLQGASG